MPAEPERAAVSGLQPERLERHPRFRRHSFPYASRVASQLASEAVPLVVHGRAVPDGSVATEEFPPVCRAVSRTKLPGRDVRPSSPEPEAPEAVCLLVVCFRYRLPNVPHSPASYGRERQRLGMLPDGL